MTHRPAPLGAHIKAVAAQQKLSGLELAIDAKMAEPTYRRRVRSDGGDFKLSELARIATRLGYPGDTDLQRIAALLLDAEGAAA